MKTMPWDRIETKHFTSKEIKELDAAVEAEMLAISRRALPSRLKKPRPIRRRSQK